MLRSVILSLEKKVEAKLLRELATPGLMYYLPVAVVGQNSAVCISFK